MQLVNVVFDSSDILSVLKILFLMLYSNCCSLEMLKLECPKLTSLFLQVSILHLRALSIFLAMSFEDILMDTHFRFCTSCYLHFH